MRLIVLVVFLRNDFPGLSSLLDGSLFSSGGSSVSVSVSVVLSVSASVCFISSISSPPKISNTSNLTKKSSSSRPSKCLAIVDEKT